MQHPRTVLAAALCSGALAALAPARAGAAVVAIDAGRDNTLYEDPAGGLSNGAGEFIFAGSTGQGSKRRALLWFDLVGAVPDGATIDSVTLTAHMVQTNAGPESVALHRLLADWGEAGSDAAGGEGSGAPAMPGDATWLHTSFDTDLWASAGGDFDPLAAAVTLVDQIGAYDWSSPEMVAEVQGWLDAPGGNHGWLMMGNESGFSTTKKFGSRESLDPALRPQLIVTFTPIPGPPALAVLAAAGAVRCGRRRR